MSGPGKTEDPLPPGVGPRLAGLPIWWRDTQREASYCRHLQVWLLGAISG
jgi:hypothetical protein